MAFWGIEVRAGKPYTHLYDNARGRLRISQAALGNGKSTNKSSLQINVGNRSPILLCNLIPNVLETCHLELEFEEVEEVIFSVLGQRSVHLSGYYIGSSMRELDGDETDSYGEDIADTDASGSYNRSDDEEYESDFIDDDDIEMSSPARRKSSVVNEEIIENDNLSNGNAKRRCLKKKHQSDSDDRLDGSQGKPVVQHNNSAVLESEDEDCFPISFSLRRKITISDSEDDETMDEDRKKKTDAVSNDSKSTSFSCKETCHPCDTSLPSDIGQENNVKLKKDEKPLHVISKVLAEEREDVEPDKDQDDKEVGIHKENGEANDESRKAGVDGTETGRKEKKKKKKMKRGKISEAAIEGINEADNNDKMDQDDKVVGIHKENGVQFGDANDESRRAGVDVTATDGKEKKKKKKMKKGKIFESAVEGTNEADNNDKTDQDSPISNEMEKLPHHSGGAVPSVLSPPTQETRGRVKKKSKKRTRDDRVSEAEGGEVADVNQTGSRKKEKKKVSEAEGREVADVNQTGARKKEKKKYDKGLSPNQAPIEQEKLDETKVGLKSRVSHIEEDLAKVKPNSKRATLLKKV